jgi:hypothetical protein
MFIVRLHTVWPKHSANRAPDGVAGTSTTYTLIANTPACAMAGDATLGDEIEAQLALR